MSKKKSKFYVVWRGFTPGVYTDWAECAAQVKGFPDAKYKAFATRDEAETAAGDDPESHIGRSETPPRPAAVKVGEAASSATTSSAFRPVHLPGAGVLAKIGGEALCVDAACAGNPGAMEYRGVYLPSGREIFHFGPVHGTNNIGEFLAIVHALALQERQGVKMPVYSDSATAISWVRRKQCRTQLAHTPKTADLYAMIARAEAWLKARRITTPVLKWNTAEWGEIPADFGRK